MDASALIAILRTEASAKVVASRLHGFSRLFIAAPTVVETRIALTRRLGRDAKPDIDRLIEFLGAIVVPFGPVHAEIAHDTYLRYGKGRHPAALNFGDCMAYATAKVARAELIYVGDDFAQTDLA